MEFQAAKSSKKPMNTTAIIEQAGLKAEEWMEHLPKYMGRKGAGR